MNEVSTLTTQPITEPRTTIRTFHEQGYVSHYRQDSPAAERCSRLSCPHCSSEGMKYLAMRWESGQVVDFAECGACGYADELRTVELEEMCGRCSGCNSVCTPEGCPSGCFSNVCDLCGNLSDRLTEVEDRDIAVGYSGVLNVCCPCLDRGR